MNKSDLIAIRDADIKSDDVNFIYASWLKGLRYGNPWFELIESAAYFRVYHKVIEMLISNPKNTVKIACLKEDPEVIVGYSVYSNNRLDWVFVKKAWRSIGIAKSLVPATTTTVSHVTNVGLGILKKYPTVVFNPFDL